MLFHHLSVLACLFSCMFCYFSLSFGETLGGPKHVPKSTQNPLKIGPKWYQNGPKMLPKCSQNGPQNRPKCSPKPIPGSLQGGPKRSFDLGSILDPCRPPSWAHLGPSWGHLGPSWGSLGLSWGHLGTILGPSWATLGPSWIIFGAILGHLGAVFGILGPACAILGPFCAILEHLGPILAPFLCPFSFANLGFPGGKRTFA